jgi:hypothetical protein
MVHLDGVGISGWVDQGLVASLLHRIESTFLKSTGFLFLILLGDSSLDTVQLRSARWL